MVNITKPRKDETIPPSKPGTDLQFPTPGQPSKLPKRHKQNNQTAQNQNRLPPHVCAQRAILVKHSFRKGNCTTKGKTHASVNNRLTLFGLHQFVDPGPVCKTSVIHRLLQKRARLLTCAIKTLCGSTPTRDKDVMSGQQFVSALLLSLSRPVLFL